MKRIGLIIPALIIAGVALWQLTASSPKVLPAKDQAPVEQEKTVPKVSVTIDFGDSTIRNFTDITASTPFEALQNATTANSLPVEIKKYDFGTLVESINGFKNSADKAWVYYVNGQSGTVASDKYELKNGDIVEWKYVKPE